MIAEVALFVVALAGLVVGAVQAIRDERDRRAWPPKRTVAVSETLPF